MRRLSLLICLTGLFWGSCTLRGGEELDPTSDTKSAVTDDGMLLTAIRGSQGGTCLVRSWSSKPKEDAQFITKKGALSEQQLKTILEFIGYDDLIHSTVISPAIGSGLVLAITPKAASRPGILGDTAAFFAVMVTNKKMHKILRRIESIKPDHPDQCKDLAYFNERRESE